MLTRRRFLQAIPASGVLLSLPTQTAYWTSATRIESGPTVEVKTGTCRNCRQFICCNRKLDLTIEQCGCCFGKVAIGHTFNAGELECPFGRSESTFLPMKDSAFSEYVPFWA